MILFNSNNYINNKTMIGGFCDQRSNRKQSMAIQSCCYSLRVINCLHHFTVRRLRPLF